MTAIATFAFNAGGQGDTVTTANSGLATLTGTAPTYDNDCHEGAYCALFNTSSAYGIGGDTFSAQTDFWVSLYFKIASNPSANVYLAQWLNGSTVVGQVRINTSGAVQLRDSNTTVVVTYTGPITTGVWHRASIRIRPNNASGHQLRLYLGDNCDGSTPDFDSSGAATLAGQTQCTGVQMGLLTAVTYSYRLDYVQLATTEPAPPLTQVAVADTGAGTDTSVSSVAAPAADTGGGSDSIVRNVATPLPDGGQAVDAIYIAAALVWTETGAGSDSLSLAVGPTLTDTGGGADSLLADAAVALDDVGVAVDTVDLDFGPPAEKIVDDAGIGADGDLTVSGDIPCTDAGQVEDQLGVNAAIPVGDVGAAADKLVIGPIYNDPHTGADSLTVTVTTILVDSGIGNDLIVSTPPTPFVSHGIGVADSVKSGATTSVWLHSGGSVSIVADAGKTGTTVQDSGLSQSSPRNGLSTVAVQNISGSSTGVVQSDTGRNQAVVHGLSGLGTVSLLQPGSCAATFMDSGRSTSTVHGVIGQTAVIVGDSGADVGWPIKDGQSVAAGRTVNGQTTTTIQSDTGQGQAVAR